MQKALLISILSATVLIPLVAARGGTVKSAVRRSAIFTGVFCTRLFFDFQANRRGFDKVSI